MKKPLLLCMLIGYIASAQTPLQTFVVIGENETTTSTIPACPYITQLAGQGTWFLNYSATTHPSYPNYMIMWCASNAGITNDNDPGANSKNIANIWTALKAQNKTTEGYFEGMEKQGSLKFTFGRYAAKHNGFYALGNVPDSVMKPYSMFPADLSKCANVTWIVPDLCNDGHGTGSCAKNVKTFDSWLKNDPGMKKLYTYVMSHDAVLIITFDEGSSANNKIVFLMIGRDVAQGKTISVPYTHYNLNTTLIGWNGGIPINQGVGISAIVGWKKEPVDTTPIDTSHVCWKRTDYDSIITTTTVTRIKDSIRVACDTIVNPPADTSFYAGFYEQHYDQDCSNKTMADALIRDINAKGFNSMHTYGWSSANVTQMRALNKRIRLECPKMKEITAVPQRGPETNGAIKSFNAGCSSPLEKFDAVNFEYEHWRGVILPVDQMWNIGKADMIQVHENYNSIDIRANYYYHGWWNSVLEKAEVPVFLPKYTTAVILHDYRVGPDFSYLKGRLDDLENRAPSPGTVYDIIILPSAEPAFSQNYFKTHTVMDFYTTVKQLFDTQHYKHLRLKGYLIFTRSFLDVVQPVPPANFIMSVGNMFRSAGNPQGASSDFKNETINTWAVDSLNTK